MNSDASIKTELTYKALQAHDLVDSAAIDKMKGTFLQEIDAMLRGERDKTDMFANLCSIKLYYLKAPIKKDGSVTAEDVMAYCRGVSEAISDSKLDSNRAFAIKTHLWTCPVPISGTLPPSQRKITLNGFKTNFLFF